MQILFALCYVPRAVPPITNSWGVVKLMRKSTIAIGIAAALSTQAFVATTSADAAVKIKPSKASGPNHSTPHFKFPNRTSPSGGNVLSDQSGTPANGFPSQNFESNYDQYDAAVDFLRQFAQ